jgi:hypothetical protein
METTQVGGAKKYTIVFEHTDEQGNPILDYRTQKPKVTNIIADTPEDLVAKLAQVTLEASRTIQRSDRKFAELSARQPTAAAPEPKLEATPLTDEQKLKHGIDTQDPRKAADAVKAVVESVVPVKQITESLDRINRQLSQQERERIALEFLRANKETYFPSEANNAMVKSFVESHGWEWTVANLEIAAATLAPRLTPRPAPPAAAPQNAPPPSPENAAPQNAPTNSGRPAPTRTAPTATLRNGGGTGTPPGTPQRKMSRKEAQELLWTNRREYERLMQTPEGNAMLTEALASRA